MTQINQSYVLKYSAIQMYSLVNNVELYPEFLLGCSNVKILESSDKHMVVSLYISRLGFNCNIIAHNILNPGQSIVLKFLKSPFDSFSGKWIFSPLCIKSCKVLIDLNFRVSKKFNLFLGFFISKYFITSVMHSFCSRAEQIYG